MIGIQYPLKTDWGDVPSVVIGRRLVESNQFDSESMVEACGLMAYWSYQRDRVQRYGQCSARCNCELVVANNGELVCPHTYLPCVSRNVVEIVKLWEKVNKR